MAYLGIGLLDSTDTVTITGANRAAKANAAHAGFLTHLVATGGLLHFFVFN